MDENKQQQQQQEQLQQRAVLVAVCRDRQPMDQVVEYLDELEFLAETAHIVTEHRFVQKLSSPDSRYFVGPGKLEEIGEWCEEHEIDVIIFDDELSPSQTRNIEKALGGRRISDRTRLILDIFVQRARTAYAKTQVKLA
ncbi:MAG: GTPase HflX, partial [Tidjanibacter sp.]|nr:GTPase HflX [Tidjanibacter sp.]